MLHQTESKAQGWRAIAIFNDSSEALVYIGRSSRTVRDEFLESLTELFDEEERSRISSISLQRWEGASDAGRWLHQMPLRMPVRKTAVARMAA